VKEVHSSNSTCLQLILSLRTKTLCVLVTLLVLNTAVILAILLGVLPSGFTRIETQITNDATLRVSRHLHDELYAVLLKSLDYAIWDDTFYAFANYTEGQADSYWDANMNCQYLTAVIKMNFAAVYTFEYVSHFSCNTM
jgi:sensor domain CHASE-containing protein